MSNSMVVNTNQLQSDEDMFSDLEPLSAFEIKKDSVATQLAALMAHCGKNRSEMAEELGWKKSRVTRILSGHGNLTIKTVCEFSTHLGYDFDMVFHRYDQRRPRQPWEIQRTETTNLSRVSLPVLNLPIETQSAQEVFVDLLSGNGRENYFSFNTRTLGVETQLLPEQSSTNLTGTGFDFSIIQMRR